MEHPSEQENTGRVGRLLTILGDLLRELGALSQSVGSDREGAPESTAAPEEPEPEGAGADSTSVSAEPRIPAEIRDAVDRGFGRLFGPQPEETTPPDLAPEAGGDPVPDESWVLVLQVEEERWAIPWHRVVGARLSAAGLPESFLLDDPNEPRRLETGRVLGIWTAGELRAEQEPLRWMELEVMATPAPAPPAHAAPAGEDTLAVCVVSPSTLARRLLTRQLRDARIEVLEARDLEDPLLPADLSEIGGLFLDEDLLERWQTRPPDSAGVPPLVLLAVDRALRVPANGERSPEGAILPRPFERAEVARVVGWLRSLQDGRQLGGSDHHGEEEDDTWIFTDPFGTQGAGEHPGR